MAMLAVNGGCYRSWLLLPLLLIRVGGTEGEAVVCASETDFDCVSLIQKTRVVSHGSSRERQRVQEGQQKSIVPEPEKAATPAPVPHKDVTVPPHSPLFVKVNDPEVGATPPPPELVIPVPDFAVTATINGHNYSNMNTIADYIAVANPDPNGMTAGLASMPSPGWAHPVGNTVLEGAGSTGKDEPGDIHNILPSPTADLVAADSQQIPGGVVGMVPVVPPGPPAGAMGMGPAPLPVVAPVGGITGAVGSAGPTGGVWPGGVVPGGVVPGMAGGVGGVPAIGGVGGAMAGGMGGSPCATMVLPPCQPSTSFQPPGQWVYQYFNDTTTSTFPEDSNVHVEVVINDHVQPLDPTTTGAPTTTAAPTPLPPAPPTEKPGPTMDTQDSTVKTNDAIVINYVVPQIVSVAPVPATTSGPCIPTAAPVTAPPGSPCAATPQPPPYPSPLIR